MPRGREAEAGLAAVIGDKPGGQHVEFLDR
jgi:hypothetical protein